MRIDSVIALLKKWAIALMVAGLLQPIFLWMLLAEEYFNSSVFYVCVLVFISASLGISMLAISVYKIADHLRKKSTKALSIINIGGIYYLLNGVLMVMVEWKNPVAYFLFISGGVLFYFTSILRKKFRL